MPIKPRRIRELIEDRGCEELLYLPAYSPDYNPIEEAFSKIKGLLRKIGARSRETLIEVTGCALSAVSSREARGFSSMLDTALWVNYYETCCKRMTKSLPKPLL